MPPGGSTSGSLLGRSTRPSSVTWNATLPILVIAVAFASLLKHGIGLHPEWRRMQDIAAHWPDPTNAPLIMETDRSLLSNISGPWLLGLLGARSSTTYLLGAFFMALLAIVLPLLMSCIHESDRARRLAFIALVGGPIPAVLLGWVGGYDAAVVIALTIAVLARNVPLQAVGWFLVAFSHAAVGLVAFALWVPMAVLIAGRHGRRSAVLQVGLMAASGTLGWLVIRTLTDLWGGSIDRYSLYRSIDPTDVWSSYVANLPLTVFSVFGILWFVLLHPAIRSTTAARLLLVEGAIAGLVVPMIAIDQTRIASLVAFAAVLAWLRGAAPQLPETSVHRIWRVLAIPAVVLPIVVIWAGAPLADPWPGIAEFLAAMRGQ